MNQEQLELLINEGLSSYQIATRLNTSASTVRRYLKQYKITTKITGNKLSDKKCIVCDTQLTETQNKYCSNNCKQKAHYKKHKTDNPNTTYSQYKRGTDRKAAVIISKGGCCTSCGYKTNLGALQFHHVKEKNFPLDLRAFSNLSLERLQQEADNCIILCANCHAEHHYPQLNNW